MMAGLLLCSRTSQAAEPMIRTCANARAYHSQQRMHEEKNAEEERRPEHVKQHRASPGLSELTECRKIAVCLRCARPIGLIGVFETSGEHCRMEFFLEPLANPAQCSA